MSDALSIRPHNYLHNGRDRFGGNILGATLLRNQRASYYFNEVICANSNFTEKVEQKVDVTLCGRS